MNAERATKTSATKASLYRLSDMNLKVAGWSEDIRDRKVVDRDGEEIGKVEDLLVDEREQKVRFMEVASGGLLGLGESKFLISIDAITRVEEDIVHIDQTRERVARAPRYNPELVREESHWHEIYGYYGYPPFWGPGYVYPVVPRPPS